MSSYGKAEEADRRERAANARREKKMLRCDLLINLTVEQYESGHTAQRQCSLTFTDIADGMTLSADKAIDDIINRLVSSGGITVEQSGKGDS